VITVVVADDHPMFRDGLSFTLDQAAGIHVVAQASDGRQALSAVSEHRPDVVVMDLAMPGMNGLEATSRIAADGTHVLVLTFSEDDASVLAAMRAGALGYLRKGADPDQVVSAVRATAAGHAVFGPGIAGRMLDVFAQGEASTRDRFPELSAREREILEHLAKGSSNREIAELLVISPITVRNHVSSILAKLHLTNRREAMLRYRDQGNPPGHQS
jgi:DNA-binding NarL/FixJ family response regulator